MYFFKSNKCVFMTFLFMFRQMSVKAEKSSHWKREGGPCLNKNLKKNESQAHCVDPNLWLSVVIVIFLASLSLKKLEHWVKIFFQFYRQGPFVTDLQTWFPQIENAVSKKASATILEIGNGIAAKQFRSMSMQLINNKEPQL